MKSEGISPHCFLADGVPVKVEGVPAATAIDRHTRVFAVPGRIRFDGEPSEFVTPRAAPARSPAARGITQADDKGKLVWSRCRPAR